MTAGKRNAKIAGFCLFGIASALYGVAASDNGWWPATIFEQAFEGYAAQQLKAKNIAKVTAHPEIEKLHSVDNIATHAETIDPTQMSPGNTLICFGIDAAILIDANGNTIHKWYLPYSQAWPNPPHVPAPVPDMLTFFIDAEAFPNGDLLAIYHAYDDTPYGYGMVKMDKDSKVIWKLNLNAHHDMYVAHDNRIYTLTQEYQDNNFLPQLSYYQSPFLTDSIRILSPDGALLDTIPVVAAFMGTPYEQMLYRKFEPMAYKTNDYTHTNSVMVLENDIAAKFPMFKPGQILVSVRNLETLAVIDPETRKVVWAMRGIWKAQHEAQFMDNGNIMLFDNQGYDDGSVGEERRSRVMEVNPATGEIPWAYTGDAHQKFYSSYRGSEQILPNGNVMAMETFPGHQLLEVTPDQEVVWRFSVKADEGKLVTNGMFKAHRYPRGYFDSVSVENPAP